MMSYRDVINRHFGPGSSDQIDSIIKELEESHYHLIAAESRLLRAYDLIKFADENISAPTWKNAAKHWLEEVEPLKQSVKSFEADK